MARLQKTVLGISVLIMVCVMAYKASSPVAIDIDTLNHLAQEKSSSSDEAESRQYLSLLMFQQAGLVTALLLLPVGLVFLKNQSVSRRIGKRLSNKHHSKNRKTHKSLAEKLLATYPTLTAYDLSLCELLMDKLSSKEIAARLNISPASVNTARYRLRKKLKVPHGIDLIAFLYQFRR